MFGSITDDADTRIEADMVTSLRDKIALLPEGSPTYAIATYMIISASDAKEPKEKAKMRPISPFRRSARREGCTAFR